MVPFSSFLSQAQFLVGVLLAALFFHLQSHSEEACLNTGGPSAISVCILSPGNGTGSGYDAKESFLPEPPGSTKKHVLLRFLIHSAKFPFSMLGNSINSASGTDAPRTASHE